MEMILHSHANKTHFHKKGCSLVLILKVRVKADVNTFPVVINKVVEKVTGWNKEI